VITVVVGVAVAAVVNYIVSSFVGDIVFNAVRIAIAFSGGWLIVSAAHKSLWTAAAVGPLVLIIDHVLLKGGFFVLADYLWPEAAQGQGLLAAGGVLISFVMFLPIAVLCSWVGGFTARRKEQHVEAHP